MADDGLDPSSFPDQAPAQAAAKSPVSGGLDPSSFPDQAPESKTKKVIKAGSAAVKTGVDVGKGATKGLAEGTSGLLGLIPGFTEGATHLGNVAGGFVARHLYGEQAVSPEVTSEQSKKALEATNTAQKVGKVGEGVAEFFVPESAAEKVVEGVPKAARLLRTVGKAAATGAGSAAVAAAHGDNPTTAGALGAAGPVLEGFGPEAFTWLKEGAKTSLAKVFGARDIAAKPEFAKAVNKVIPMALDEGIKPTYRAWLSQRAAKVATAGKALEDFLAGPGGSTLVPTKPVVDALDELSNKSAQHVLSAQQTLSAATHPVQGSVVSGTRVYNERLAKHIDKLKDTVKAYGDFVPARVLHDLKQSWNEFVYQADKYPNIGKISLALEKKAKLAAISGVRSVLESDAPSVSKLDQAYHLNKTLYDVVRDAARDSLAGETTGKLAKRITQKVTGNISAGTGAVAGGAYGFEKRHSVKDAIVGTIVGGATGKMLNMAVTSPAFRTAPAVIKNELAEAIANGKADAVRRIITPFLVKGASAATAPTSAQAPVPASP